ncbi:hypothetical protein Pla144_36520 [Bythopirellula polymerisocia]|uniref:Outer membrane protein beta-barrel domain-containing protein n=2 Tax=Bythopirellula polymerisocia TaxID=2528003 RepID=A0A5C6CNY9_9BACT|nr:hypothetical protein Pla144_36520 [Bythopirellula polymerisocia]
MRLICFVLIALHNLCLGSYGFADDTQFTLDEFYEPEIAQAAIVDSAVEPASYNCQSCWNCNANCECDSCTQTVSWLSGPYFKLGLTSVLGDGLLDENRETGYTISMGGRQPVGPGLGGRRLFFDVGGSYLQAEGTTTRNVQGNQVNTTTNTSTIVDNAFQVTLEEVRRAGAHAGVGCYFGSLLDDRSEDPQARLGLVVGGRLSHIHGVFDTQQLVVPPAGNTLTQINAKSDMAGGIYVDFEALVLKRSSPLGDLQWTIDGEFAHDWIDISNFEKRGLATASLLFGFMVVR